MTILEGPCIFMSYLKIDYGAILVLPLHFFWATVVPIRLQANHKNLESKCFRKKEKLNYAEKHQSKVKGKIMKYYILKWPNILFKKKNPAYWRQRISRPMRIEGPIYLSIYLFYSNNALQLSRSFGARSRGVVAGLYFLFS